MNPKNFPRRKATRALEAQARQDRYNQLSRKEKLAIAGTKVRAKLEKEKA